MYETPSSSSCFLRGEVVAAPVRAEHGDGRGGGHPSILTRQSWAGAGRRAGGAGETRMCRAPRRSAASFPSSQPALRSAVHGRMRRCSCRSSCRRTTRLPTWRARSPCRRGARDRAGRHRRRDRLRGRQHGCHARRDPRGGGVAPLPVRLLHREKAVGGLGGAVLEGFAAAGVGRVPRHRRRSAASARRRSPSCGASFSRGDVDVVIASRYAGGGTAHGLADRTRA